MIVLLGATGYVGQAFCRVLREEGESFITLSRADVDYSRFDRLLDFLRKERPEFLVNTAGYTGKPNVDACEADKASTLQGNTLLPQTISHACHVAGIPWGHVSSGCIYTGAKVQTNGTTRVVKDLLQADVRQLVEQQPDAIHGFTEEDEPNFSFRDPPCSFYSGTKALCEEMLRGDRHSYVWRLRIPFDEFDNSRNYLTKLLRYSKVYDNINSLSHLTDFVHACLETWRRKAPFGFYNVTNSGFVTTRQVVEMMQSKLGLDRPFEYWENDDEFYSKIAATPRSNCVLDVSKLLSVGIQMRPVADAISDALDHWKWESSEGQASEGQQSPGYA